MRIVSRRRTALIASHLFLRIRATRWRRVVAVPTAAVVVSRAVSGIHFDQVSLCLACNACLPDLARVNRIHGSHLRVGIVVASAGIRVVV